jgi:hypothetical protein
MVLLRDEAQVEAQFYPFRDSANLDARLVHDLGQTYHGSEIILVAPNDTPRWRGSSGSSIQSVWR